MSEPEQILCRSEACGGRMENLKMRKGSKSITINNISSQQYI